MATAMPILAQPAQQPIAAGGGSGTNGLVPTTPTSTATPVVTAAANPYAPVPTTVNGLPPGSQQTNGINWNDGSYTTTGDFKDTYGAGTGTAITSVLQNLGTSTDSAVQATINNTNLAAGKQAANIQSSEAASGITPGSSTAALAMGDFYGTVNSNLQQVVAGMENSEEDTLLSALTSEGSAHGPDETGFQSAMDIMSPISSIVGSGANAINSTSASGTGQLSEILSMIGML